MKVRSLHDWNLQPVEAVALQRSLAGKVRERSLPRPPSLVAGVDCGYSRRTDTIYASVVLCRISNKPGGGREEIEVLETRSVAAHPPLPYIPGLLSFREAPAVLSCFRAIRHRAAAVIVDGQGRAHPRRLGLASHLGLFLGVPTVGCAKSILVGEHGRLGKARGSTTEMKHRGEVLGMATRTRSGVKPVYVSVGHLIDLAAAVRLVLRCCVRFRLPEPVRLAHHLGTTARLAAESHPSSERSSQ